MESFFALLQDSLANWQSFFVLLQDSLAKLRFFSAAAR